jgi:hypothetical protein
MGAAPGQGPLHHTHHAFGQQRVALDQGGQPHQAELCQVLAHGSIQAKHAKLGIARQDFADRVPPPPVNLKRSATPSAQSAPMRMDNSGMADTELPGPDVASTAGSGTASAAACRTHLSIGRATSH